MKKIFSALAVVMFAGAPMMAQAATFISRDQYSQGPQAPMTGNLYVAAGMVSIASGVGGDLHAAGGNISVSGRVDRDLTALGGTVQILGPVGDDVRIGGGQVSINDRVGGDVIVAGGTVNILSSALVHGDVYVAGGQVVIDGVVQGSVHMTGGTLALNGGIQGDVLARVTKGITLGSNAHVGGSFSYRSPIEAVITQGAKIDGATNYTPMAGIHVGKGVLAGTFFGVIAALTAVQVLAYLGFAVVVVWLWRRWATELVQEVNDHWWPTIGHGVIYTILVPVAAALLLMSFVGMIFGGLAILGYVILMVLAKGLSGIVFGAWLAKVIKHRPVLSVSWMNAILGTLGFIALTMIPVLGWILQIFVFLAVFGALAGRVQKYLVSHGNR